MGKNQTIYFNDNSIELLGDIEGKGTLINKLIEEHFSSDEDILQRRVELAEQSLNALKAKLSIKVEHRLKLKTDREEKDKLSEEEQERKNRLESHKSQYKNKKITDKAYFAKFNKKTGKFTG